MVVGTVLVTFCNRRRRLWKRLLCNDPWLVSQDNEGSLTESPSATTFFNLQVGEKY